MSLSLHRLKVVAVDRQADAEQQPDTRVVERRRSSATHDPNEKPAAHSGRPGYLVGHEVERGAEVVHLARTAVVRAARSPRRRGN